MFIFGSGLTETSNPLPQKSLPIVKSKTDKLRRTITIPVSHKIEIDPTGKNPHEPGAKLDHGKAPIWQGALSYFPRAIQSVAEVSAFGASKYAWKGWETVPDGYNRYSDAMVRHIAKEGAGELTDPDSKLYHAAHTAWNALARLELLIREQQPGG